MNSNSEFFSVLLWLGLLKCFAEVLELFCLMIFTWVNKQNILHRRMENFDISRICFVKTPTNLSRKATFSENKSFTDETNEWS